MDNLEQKISDLSQAIRETKQYRDHENAARVYGGDEAAQKLMNDFQMAQQEYLILQQGGFSGQEEAKVRFEDLLDGVRSNKPINELVEARRKMEDLVGGLAVALSNDIGFPFNLPPKKGCGCSG